VFNNRISSAIRLHVAATSLAQNASNTGQTKSLKFAPTIKGNCFRIENNYSNLTKKYFRTSAPPRIPAHFVFHQWQRSGFEKWGRRYTEEFWHDQTPTDIVGQSDEKTCLARIRTYNSLPEHQALTEADAHLDAHKLRDSSELMEVIKAWAALPAPFKKAILALVRPGL
jgi:hypothetical protein